MLVEATGDSGHQARKVEVRTMDVVGELRRIESEELAPGSRIVVKGVHYLMPGARVTIAEEMEARP